MGNEITFMSKNMFICNNTLYLIVFAYYFFINIHLFLHPNIHVTVYVLEDIKLLFSAVR